MIHTRINTAHRALLSLVFFFVLLAHAKAADASPPANACAGPCYVCAVGNTCTRRWWADLDTTIMSSFPAQIERRSDGHLVVNVCQQQGQSASVWCGDRQPGTRTLRQWCQELMALPVPPRLHASDPGDLYSCYQAGGVCP